MGQVFVSNIGQTSGGSSNGGLNLDRAQAFTTGSHNPGYTVKSVDILFNENSIVDLFGTSNPRLTVTIRNESGGNPGTTVVGALNLPRSSPTFDTARTMTFRAPAKGIKLSPSTTYFLVIDFDTERSSGRDAKLKLVVSDAEDAGGAAGFSIGNQSLYYASWNNAWESGNSWRMSVKGEPNPITDLVQMSNATRRIAEFGNGKAQGGARFVVEISDGLSPKGYPRTINYTVDGSADRGDGKDYTIDGCTSSSCSVRLSANNRSNWITIYVNNDGIDEMDETIILTLQDGSGYTVNKDKRTTTITITDDDTRGLTFHRRWPSLDEGGSETSTVRLSSQPTAAVTVNIASNNQDVTVSPTSLTFNPSGSNLWSRARIVTVSAAQDNDAVDDEATLTYTTSGGDYGGANALSIGRPVSVDDDDTADPIAPRLPRISLTGGPAVTEGAAASFTVNADPAPTSNLTVSVEVSEPPGQDFVAASEERVRTVVLNAGATSTTFTVPTVDDSTDEDEGAVVVFVNDGAGYVAGQGGVVTVRDNDSAGGQPTASFAAGSSSAAENAGTRNVRVNLSSAAPSGGLTLGYNVAGTATAGNGNDFTIQGSGTLTIAAGATFATIPVAINDDNATESAETVILTLTGGTGYTVGSPSVHTLTISDNDGSGQPTASFAAGSSGAAENAGTRNVRVNLSSAAPSGGLTLGYNVAGTATAGNGNDFTIQGSGTLTIAAGATFATIPVAINDDGSAESAETVILTLTGGTGYTVGSPSVHTLTITDNDSLPAVAPTPEVTITGGNAITEGGIACFTLTATPAPSSSLDVSVSVADDDASDFVASGNEVSRTVAIPTSGMIIFTVSTENDAVDEANGSVSATVNIGSGYTVGTPSSATVTVNDNDDPPPPPPLPSEYMNYLINQGIPESQLQQDLDPDSDGVPNVFEYYFGTDASDPASFFQPIPIIVRISSTPYNAIQYVRNPNAVGVTISVEFSYSLSFDSLIGSVPFSNQLLENGLEEVVVRSGSPLSGREFSRLIYRSEDH